MTPPAPVWRLTVEVPASVEAVFTAAIESLCVAVVSQERGAGMVGIDGYRDEPPDRRELALRLDLAATSAGIAVPGVAIAPVQPVDWLAESERSFPPIPAGRFLIHPQRYPGPLPAGRVAIAVDAGMAFGSGHHGSTAGCLMALSRLHGLRPRRAVDIGCGSGILAIAMARVWHCRVLAVDIDPRAVRVAAENARINGVAHLIRSHWADGWTQGPAGRSRGADVITCNILPRPVKRLLPGIASRLAPGGTAILGGFQDHQGQDILAVCRRVGLALATRIVIDGWCTLVVRRPGVVRRSG